MINNMSEQQIIQLANQINRQVGGQGNYGNAQQAMQFMTQLSGQLDQRARGLNPKKGEGAIVAQLQQQLKGAAGYGDAQPIDQMVADPGSVLQNRLFQLPQYQLQYGTQGAETPIDPIQRYLTSGQYSLFNQAPTINSNGTAQTPSTPMPEVPRAPTQEQFFSNPMYQLMFGANNNQTDPQERFKADPGYQFSVNEALKQMQQTAAAKGMGMSGGLLTDMTKQAQGAADQQYQRWLGNQSSLYNSVNTNNQYQYAQDQAKRAQMQNEYSGFVGNQAGIFNTYQNQLAGLTQMGNSNTGSQNAYNLGTNQANMNMNTGQQQSGAALQTGSNISSLFGNQGVFGGSSMLNTGAGIANYGLQGQGMNSQIQSANNANQAGTINSLFTGIGNYMNPPPQNVQQQQQQLQGYRY